MFDTREFPKPQIIDIWYAHQTYMAKDISQICLNLPFQNFSMELDKHKQSHLL